MTDSRWADLDGPVHWVDFGGPARGPLLVCVHGLGGSHVNWLAVAPVLTATCRVVALDLAGFGLTRGGERSTTVQANRELLHRFVTEVVGAPAILVGNSMGGMISAFEAAVHPQDVAGVVLIDPAVPPALRSRPDPLAAALFAAYFTPGVGKVFMNRRRRQHTAEEIARETLRLCCAHPERVSPDILDAHIRLGQTRPAYAEQEAEFMVATRSLLVGLARRRVYASTLRRVSAPVLLIHGDKDRLIPVSSARATARAHPDWRYEELPDAGHVPQLELPDRTATLILDWMATQGAVAAEAARAAVVVAGRRSA